MPCLTRFWLGVHASTAAEKTERANEGINQSKRDPRVPFLLIWANDVA